MIETPPDWTQGRPGLVVQSCSVCGHRWYSGCVFCPNCGSGDVVASASAGRGTVYAVTRVDRAPLIGVSAAFGQPLGH